MMPSTPETNEPMANTSRKIRPVLMPTVEARSMLLRTAEIHLPRWV